MNSLENKQLSSVSTTKNEIISSSSNLNEGTTQTKIERTRTISPSRNKSKNKPSIDTYSSGKKRKMRVSFNEKRFVEVVYIENWSNYNRSNVHQEHSSVDDTKCRCIII